MGSRKNGEFPAMIDNIPAKNSQIFFPKDFRHQTTRTQLDALIVKYNSFFFNAVHLYETSCAKSFSVVMAKKSSTEHK